ncbi:MAG TPA: 1,4-dihydroxy-6-naphthoate synthase [Ferruginibacter sp.]|nr:1,4-dihydroxy-6-naphthoate synthase [Ferruginibacter sp.]HMP21542.1 1,4-dihydroxy-6-naphthoate synthase [Ferruginibacter sp.]
MKLTLGFSPCPNDTFVFDALVNKKIDTAGIDVDVVLEDVQTLNEWALEGRLDITKISYGVLPLVAAKYALLDSGSALGSGVGPLLITSDNTRANSVESSAVAIPGKNTTAHLLFSLAYPEVKNKVFVRYNEVEQFVLEGKGNGVIIHENRFTYQQKGLHKITDLGDYWEQKTGCPIPLGGIVCRRDIDASVQHTVNSLIRKSTEYAFAQYPELSAFIKNHAQEMSEEVMRQHINLYVNNYTLSLGEPGRKAVNRLMEVYRSANGESSKFNTIFAG